MTALKLKKLALLLSLIIFPSIHAQAQYTVTASVTDTDGEPEEYATYRIFAIPDTIHPIVGDVTPETGTIDATLPGEGDYRLTVSAAMKLPVTVDFSVSPGNPQADLGVISTEYAGETLNEITVSAQRPLVVKEIDRIGYDVSADAQASTSTLRQILQKVPMVTVEDDGTIKVNGSTDFKVYRNGRPNNAFTKNSKDIFAAIPASTIKKIEVITDPGAREDADSSGMILNIVTTSTSSMSGVSGSVGAKYSTGQGPQANAFIMTQLNKLTLSGSGGFYSYSKKIVKGRQEGKSTFDDTGDTLETNSDFQAGGHGGWFNVEGSLDIDTLNLLTTSLNGFVARNAHDMQSHAAMYDRAGNVGYSYDQESFYTKNGYNDIDFSFDYQHSTRLKGETLTLSYRLSHTRQDMDQTTNYYNVVGSPFNYRANLSDFDLNFFEHTFQFDWSRPFGTHYKLDTGLKYILRSSHSTNHQTLTDVAQTFDDFKHIYNIFAVYADARATYGKVTARAGLRYEYSRLSAEFLAGDQDNFHSNLNDVVPNASVAWNASRSSMWKLSYNRRIQRPGISYLNPAVSIYPNSVSYGNPNLQSASVNNIVLNYGLLKSIFNLDLTATYIITNNGTAGVQWSEGNTTYSTYDNLLHKRGFTFSAFFQWQMTDKTSWMFNGNFERSSYSLNTLSRSIRLARSVGYFYTRVQQRLPWELILSLGLNYFSGYCNGPYQYASTPASNIGYSLGLNRTFLKNKTLDVSLSLENIGLADRKFNLYVLNNGTTGLTRTTQKGRQAVTVGVTWRFGSLRTQVKKAAATITNDDLDGRKNSSET